MIFRPNLILLAAIGAVLISSLLFLIWRSWHAEGTSASEQKNLLLVALNTALVPLTTLSVGLVLRPRLGILAAVTLAALGASLWVLSRAHATVLGHDGLYRRVRNLSAYYAYLFFLLSQFPKVHVTLSWYLGDPARAQLLLVGALFVPALAALLAARPSGEEWGRWWPIRQWSALFLISCLAAWMTLHP
jgi:hypothetical protein